MQWSHDRYGEAIVMGMLGAQAALVAVWIVLGLSRFTDRLSAAVLAFVWFAVELALWLDLVVFLCLQVAVTTGALSCSQGSSRCVLATGKLEEEGLRAQFRIVHLLVLMVAAPLVWGVGPLLEYLPFLAHSFEDLGPSLLLAAGFATPPLIACWAIFGRGGTRQRTLGAAIGLPLAATVMAYVGFAQTHSIETALTWVLWCVTETAFAAVSFLWLRHLGFRVGRPAEPSTPSLI